MNSSPRRSERLRGKEIDYTVFFKQLSLKKYVEYYKSRNLYNLNKAPALRKTPRGRRSDPNRRRSEPQRRRSEPQRRRSEPQRKKPQPQKKKSKPDAGNTWTERVSAAGDSVISVMKPLDRVKQTLTKLTTKCRTKGLMSSILGAKFSCSTPIPLYSRNLLLQKHTKKKQVVETPSLSTLESASDDYFAHLSPIKPPNEESVHVSVSDVIDISLQFADVKKKTRKNLTSIAEEVKGRPLAKDELDELQTTIQDLDLSNYYQTHKTPSPSQTEQSFVPKPIELESIASTPRSSVFRFENNRFSPRSIRYARHVEREYSYVRRRCRERCSSLEINSNIPQNKTNTSKMLDSTYTNVNRMMRNRRSSDSYEEESD